MNKTPLETKESIDLGIELAFYRMQEEYQLNIELNNKASGRLTAIFTIAGLFTIVVAQLLVGEKRSFEQANPIHMLAIITYTIGMIGLIVAGYYAFVAMKVRTFASLYGKDLLIADSKNKDADIFKLELLHQYSEVYSDTSRQNNDIATIIRTSDKFTFYGSIISLASTLIIFITIIFQKA